MNLLTNGAHTQQQWRAYLIESHVVRGGTWRHLNTRRGARAVRDSLTAHDGPRDLRGKEKSNEQEVGRHGSFDISHFTKTPD